MLNTLAVSGYRSLRDLVVSLDRLNLVTGPNGSGKSNLYRALRLLAETAQGGVIQSLAREGGLQSTLWAGPERFARAVLRGEQRVEGVVRKGPVSLRLGFAGDDFSYAIDLGLPPPGRGAFAHDPEIKRECVWSISTSGVFRGSAQCVMMLSTLASVCVTIRQSLSSRAFTTDPCRSTRTDDGRSVLPLQTHSRLISGSCAKAPRPGAGRPRSIA